MSFGNHSDLGRVVQAIKRELEKNPPIFPQQQQSQRQQQQQQQQLHSSQIVNMPNGVSPYLQQQQPQRGYSSPLVNSDSSFQKLSQLSVEQLQELDQNPVALKIFIRSLLAPDKQPGEVQAHEVRLVSMVDANLSEMKRHIDAVIAERRTLSEQVKRRFE